MALNRLDRMLLRVIVGILIVLVLIFGVPLGLQMIRNAERHSLLQAAAEGDTTRVESLLARGVDPNSREDAGVPAAGAAQPSLGFTALELAIKNNHPNTATVLLKHGAQPYANTLAMIAQQIDPKVVFDWIENGIQYQDVFAEAATAGNAKLMRAMLVRYPDLKQVVESKGMLLDAATKGQTDVVETLLESGANTNVRDNYDTTPLMRAAKIGNVDVARVLLAKGTDVNATTRYGNSALYYALQFGHPDVANLLEQAGGKDLRGPEIPYSSQDPSLQDPRIQPGY